MSLRYWLEYIALIAFLGLCKIIPYPYGPKLVAAIIALVGPLLAKNKIAVRHIQKALNVDLTTAYTISKGMWDNLGHVAGEYPQLQSIAKNHVIFKGEDYIKQLRDDGRPGILFGAHLGNWEVIPHALLHHFDFAMHPVYRAPNNPKADEILQEYRQANGRLNPYAKSVSGTVGMIKALKKGEHLGLLVDQKLNEGIMADFFGMPAKTGTAFIELAQKYDCPLVPIRCVRIAEGFLIEALPAIDIKGRETEDILADVHAILEQWIKDYPEQWLWLHRRWKKEDLK